MITQFRLGYQYEKNTNLEANSNRPSLIKWIKSVLNLQIWKRAHPFCNQMWLMSIRERVYVRFATQIHLSHFETDVITILFICLGTIILTFETPLASGRSLNAIYLTINCPERYTPRNRYNHVIWSARFPLFSLTTGISVDRVKQMRLARSASGQFNVLSPIRLLYLFLSSSSTKCLSFSSSL